MDTNTKKLNILVAIDELPAPFWTRLSEQAQICHVRDGTSAYQMLAEQSFDLTFVDLFLMGMDGLELLRRIRSEHLCPAVALTSEAPSFSYAQQGILNGVCAYLLRPLQESEVQSVIHKTRTAASPEDALLAQAAEQVVHVLRTAEAEAMFLTAGERLLLPTDSPIAQGLRWHAFYEEVIQQTYQKFHWLHLYCHPGEFLHTDYLRDQDNRMVQNFCIRKFAALNAILSHLFPLAKNLEMERILRYLLQHIDDSLQQKELAERFYVTNSTISTRFQRQLGISYRGYMTRIKIQRAQYLLRYTKIHTRDLAARLGYRDQEYFSKLFFQHTGKTLQEYESQLIGTHYSI